jgi:hypothetical protein
VRASAESLCRRRPAVNANFDLAQLDQAGGRLYLGVEHLQDGFSGVGELRLKVRVITADLRPIAANGFDKIARVDLFGEDASGRSEPDE